MGEARRFVVLGAGLAGARAAIALRDAGFEGRLVLLGEEPALPYDRVPLSKQYLRGEPGGRKLFAEDQDYSGRHGIELRLSCSVTTLDARNREMALASGERLGYDALLLATGARARRLRVPGVSLGGIRYLRDAIVAGIGAAPRVELAQAAGLAVDDGVLTDAHLATSIPGIFAAGDVARAWHPRLACRIRLEHWSSALGQGPAAARNMLGITTAYDRVPFFFSDQYDVGMEYSGSATGWDQVIVRGDPSDRKFIVFWLKDGLLVAGMNVNTWNVVGTIAALVAARRPIEAAALADPAVDLARLVPAAT